MGAETWGSRWDSAGGLAKQWMGACVAKQSLVVLAADRYTMSGLTSLLDEVSESVVALKTHVDLVVDWTAQAWGEFCETAHSHGMLIFEDRKFADIGKISRDQMGGVYDIRSWSDLVTAHLISGPDIVAGLQEGWKDVGREGGVLLLAQMSSRGNLLDENYTNAVIAAGKENDGVFGFIGNGSKPEGLRELRKLAGDKMIWTPGVNLTIGDGEMGQQYGDPYEAVLAGSDGIIVGSGIHRANDPARAARAYADASWRGLLERN